MNLFLDLEGTVIKSVDEPVLLTKFIPVIKQAVLECESLAIFSFAIHNDDDVMAYGPILDLVRETFGKEFRVIKKDELFPIMAEKLPGIDVMDFIDLSKDKEDMFRMFVRAKHSEFHGPDFMLIDDTVENTSMSLAKKLETGSATIEMMTVNIVDLVPLHEE